MMQLQRHILLCLAFSALVVVTAFGQNNDVGNNDSDTASAPEIAWHFEGVEAGSATGPIDADAAGPRSPQYPSFKPSNRAAFFSGDGTSIVLREADSTAKLRFGLQDSLTLEAWVRVKELKNGSYAYVIGKGRTRKAAWADKNHNYALRLYGSDGRSQISFLFATPPAGDRAGDWHRWTSTDGFTLDDKWHHVAVVYTFGRSVSLRGYIDGRRVQGKWDMGGATELAPVQDADDLVLATGNGGGAGNSLHGWLDAVAIHRVALPEDTLKARFQYIRIARRKPVTQPLPGQVLVELCESGLAAANVWPDESPETTESWSESAFGFFEVPHKYVDTGVRGDRPIPYLLRATAAVQLPAGKHRLLLRARGASQLQIDGRPILSTPFPSPSSDGHHPIPKDFLDLGPTFRFAPPGNRESWAHFESAGGSHFVELETVVGSFTGNKPRRPELGETVVAISLDGSDDWQLLSPSNKSVPYTDEGWEEYARQRRIQLGEMNAQRRAALRDAHRSFWDRRAEVAKRWLAETPEVPVPELAAGFPANNAIDHFLAEKLTSLRDMLPPSGDRVDFFAQVQPLLQAHCLNCHQGPKAKGGLRLDRSASARVGGESGTPAVVPRQPDQSEMLRRIRLEGSDASERMPPNGDRLKPAEIAVLDRWIREGAVWPDQYIESAKLTPLTDDLAFLRRVTLDTVGVVPTLEEVKSFLADTRSDKRQKVIERLLSDPRWADHWMGYWQDVLAENPNILNPTLNNTGPFRWWIYESLLDDKPLDLFVTELLRMKGSERLGGPAGFGVASQNDVPMAAKGTIVSAAFLGIEMKCARCHDSPYHVSGQEDLFQLAALLAGKPLEVPKTSSVPLDKLHQGGRTPLIEVTLKPGTKVAPRWPLGDFVDESLSKELAEDPADTRDRLAALITAPQNERFAQVMANRIWQRFMGRGIVEPVEDWEKGQPTHPELLRWLGRELVRSRYNAKHIARLILNSHAYQRATDPALRGPHPFYAAPATRRLTAEQVVDSLFSAVGRSLGTEEINLDVDGQRDMGNSISLGQPSRAWMLASTSNERDRPSLSLPRVQAVVDMLAAFGWRPARQDPTSQREQACNILQPAVIANGTVSVWLNRLSDKHGITELALRIDQTPDKFVDDLFLRLLTRLPTDEERAKLVAHISPGFDDRVIDFLGVRRPDGAVVDPSSSAAPAKGASSHRSPELPRERQRPRYVSWSNHLSEEANEIKVELEAASRRGDPPTDRLNADWRSRAEDVLWSLLNAPEWIYMP